MTDPPAAGLARGHRVDLMAPHADRLALVGDTGALMKDVCRSLRGEQFTSLLAGLQIGSGRLYIARHVQQEMNRNLPGFAHDRGHSPDAAVARWQEYYLPRTWIVDVPETWGQHHPGTAAVAARHDTDLPTARLATALTCPVVGEDRDLIDHGFGDRNWLPVAHHVANEALIIEAGYMVGLPTAVLAQGSTAIARHLSRAPVWAQLVLLCAAAALLRRWQTNGQAGRHLRRAGSAALRAAEWAEPRVEQALARRAESDQAWQEQRVTTSATRLLSEYLAEALSVAPTPPLAADLARQLPGPGPLAARTVAIRSVLLSNPAFHQVTRGRWQLGEHGSTADVPTAAALQTAWLRRATAVSPGGHADSAP